MNDYLNTLLDGPTVMGVLLLTFGNWSLYIYSQSEPHVLEESKEMADIFGQNASSCSQNGINSHFRAVLLRQFTGCCASFARHIGKGIKCELMRMSDDHRI